MAAYFLCLTAEGGVPLFCRTRGDLKPLPFPILGSLNGVHMFCKSHGVDLKSTATEDAKIIWKDYNNSLSLVVVGDNDVGSDVHLTSLLDLVFKAMVLLYGLEDTTNIKHVERFKREIKVCYKLIDSLLGHSPSSIFGDVSQTVDVIAAPENNTPLQSYIDAFAEAADSPYGCLLVAGKVTVATATWWQMSAAELVLLPMLISSLPQSTSQDVAIFLPDISPTVPHRLLTFQLLPSVIVCVICGPNPPLAKLEAEVERFWGPSLESLRSVSRLHPRNFPLNISLDVNILGFILKNSASHRCLCSVFPHMEDTKQRPRGDRVLLASDRRQILRSFYKSVMSQIWSPHSSQASPDEFKDLHSRLSHDVQETYLCTEKHKCYALHDKGYHLFLLYSTQIPTYAMRSVSHKTLDVLLKDKNVTV